MLLGELIKELQEIADSHDTDLLVVTRNWNDYLEDYEYEVPDVTTEILEDVSYEGCGVFAKRVVKPVTKLVIY